MKRIIIILLVSTCMLSSCSNNIIETEPTTSETTAEVFTELQKNIKCYNQTLVQNQTRGFWERLFNRVLKVFVADCVGAIKGAVSNDNIWQSAQGASLNSARKQTLFTGVDAINTYVTRSVASDVDTTATQALQPKSEALQNLILVDDMSSATAIDSIGYYHNAIIYSTLEKDNSLNFWKSVSDYACILKINEEITRTIPTQTYNDTVLNRETVDFCKFISNKSVECDDYQGLLRATSDQYPKLRNLLETTSGFFEGMELVSSEDEWEQYCKGIINLISNSNIPDKDKKALQIGISVGYASSKLWKTE